MQLPSIVPGKRFTLSRPVGSADALLLARLADRAAAVSQLTAIVTAEPADAQRYLEHHQSAALEGDRQFEPVGVYKSTVAAEWVDYSQPQENGNKTDVRWVALTNPQGIGLLAVGQLPLSVAAREYSNDEIDRADYTFGELLRSREETDPKTVAIRTIGADATELTVAELSRQLPWLMKRRWSTLAAIDANQPSCAGWFDSQVTR